MEEKINVTDVSEVALISSTSTEVSVIDRIDDLMIIMMKGLKEALEENLGLNADMSVKDMMAAEFDNEQLAKLTVTLALMMQKVAQKIRNDLHEAKQEQNAMIRHLFPILGDDEFSIELEVGMKKGVPHYSLMISPRLEHEEETLQ